jgi:REP element-mobilizing transposase RayT
MNKFRNKYRISSARLPNWDYGWNGGYFITICTAHRELFFGNIVHGEIILSEMGEMANKFWLEIPEHFPFVKLDVHVVMPNHVHGIIVIDKTDDGRNVGRRVGRNVETPNLGVSTTPPPQSPQSPPPQSSPPRTAAASQNWKPASLGAIINQYKRICTINARKIHAGFAWQSRFHDHIIRNNAEYQRIKNYIISNPKKWNDDALNA